VTYPQTYYRISQFQEHKIKEEEEEEEETQVHQFRCELSLR